MGAVTSSLKPLIGGKKEPEIRILMNGLDAAGKTTILYKLKLGEVITTIPTIGFNVETVSYKNIAFSVWDVGGRNNMRALFRHYYQGTHAVVWVLDSNDRDRIDQTKEELEKSIREDALADAVFLVLCNKQDLPNAMSLPEIEEKLSIRHLRSSQVEMFSVCATTGDGLYEALDWLSRALKVSMENGSLVGNSRTAEPRLITMATPGSTEVFTAPGTHRPRMQVDFQDPWSALSDEELLEMISEEGAKKKPRSPNHLLAPHSVKLRFIWLHLSRLQDRKSGRKAAVDAIMNGLKASEPLMGVFHMTATYFWIQLVDLALHLPADQQAMLTARAPAHPVAVFGMDATGPVLQLDAAARGAGAGAAAAEAPAVQAAAPAAPAPTTTEVTATPVALSADAQAAKDASIKAFTDFINANYYLADNQVLYDYYSPHQILYQPATMTEFALPDKKPLPSVLNFNVLSPTPAAESAP